jgi:hypothetical protein
MKTIKNFATLVLCLITTMVFAGISPEVAIKETDQKAFTLYIDNTNGGRVDVYLKDANGELLQSERIKKPEAITQKYNLENLPVGEYKLIIEDGPKTITQTIVLGEYRLTVPKNLRAEYFEPTVVLNNDNLDFTMLTPHETLVVIEIIDENGFKNYSVGTCEKGTVQRRFDISALEPGTYTVATHVEGQNFETVYHDTFTIGSTVAGW